MAKNTQEAEVIVTLNGQAAKRAIKEMEQEYERLTKAALEAHKAGNDALGKELDAQAEKLTRDIQITRRETKKFADIMKNINGASLKELRSAAKQLQSEINKLTPGTKQFIEKSKQLKEVNTRIRQLTNEFKGLVEEEKRAAFSLKGLAEGFNRYFGMVTAGVAAITGISMAFRKAAQDAAALDDVYSDVMKTTGLLHEEVVGLDKELMKINTRTSREQLLLLARDAGKLGIQGKENILGFVRAADQIQVALGEDLGEGAIKNLGKIADVFGLTKEMGIEKSLLSIASAVNALGQASTASEAYLVDFAQRLAGVGAMAGLSVQDILGFASGLDQSAMKVEMAATAFQKFLMKMYEEPAKFAKYAGMQVEEFTELLKTNANEAITVVMKAMNGQDGFAAMVPVFNEMGLDGARAVGVLSAMTQNLEAVTEAQRLANVEFAKGTSVTEEYNTKNNNLQANLEKARKEFQNASIALGQSLNPIMLKTTKATTYLVKALATYGKEIKAAVISIAAFTIAVKANAIATAAHQAILKGITLVQKTYTVVVNAASYAINIMRGRTIAATKAYIAMKAAMSTSVFGLLATAIAAVTVAIVHYTKKAKEASEVTKKMEEIQDRINSEYAESASKVQVLTDIVHNNNLAIDQRRDALKKLKEIVPAYHADLTKEGELINDNTEALAIYLKNLEKVTRAKILEDEYTQATARVLKAEQDKRDAEQRRLEALERANGNTQERTHITMQSSAGAYSVSELTPYGEAVRDVTDATNELTEAQQIQGQILQQIQRENGDAFATRKGELTAEEMEIRILNQEYQQLFHAIRDENMDNPEKAAEQIADFQKELQKKIAEIRKKYKDVASANEDPGGGGGSGNSSSSTNANSEYQEELKALKHHLQERKNLTKQLYADGQITKEQYDEKLLELDMKYLERQVELARDYGEDETQVMSAFLDAQIAANDRAYAEMMKMKEDWEAANEEDFERWQKEFEELQAQAKEIKAQLDPKGARMSQMDDELSNLDKLHDAKLLSEEEYEKAVQQLRKKYADENLQDQLGNIEDYIKQSNAMMEQASNFVNSLKEYETQKAEAEYQAQLTAAGDNAEQREAVEAAYEQKKLEIQKKYADTEMVINIAKTVAAGALAAIQAFAQLGPIGGAVAAALIAVTTAMEVATIVQQRNAIKNSSVNSSGSSSAPKTGNRTMTGYSEGGETPWAPSDNTPVGIVHANEYVIPAWMKRREPVLISNLERYRKAGSHGRSGSASRGFIDGGDTGSGAFGMKDGHTDHGADMYTIVRAAVVDSFESGAVRIVLVRKDISEIDNQDSRLKKQTSRWNS